jgi:hypothetical protein
MTSKDKLKNVGKNIIGYPEETVAVPSSVDWVQNQIRDPKDRVSPTASSFAVPVVLTHIQGDWIFCQIVSYLGMD